MSCPFNVRYYDKDDNQIWEVQSNAGLVSSKQIEWINFVNRLPWVPNTEYIKVFGGKIPKNFLAGYYFKEQYESIYRTRDIPVWINFHNDDTDRTLLYMYPELVCLLAKGLKAFFK